MIFTIIYLSLIGPSLCAIGCVRNTRTSLDSMFRLLTTTRSQREHTWFSMEYTKLFWICKEIMNVLYNIDAPEQPPILISKTMVNIHGTPTPRNSFLCAFNENEFRIFPISKMNTVFVSVDPPVEVDLISSTGELSEDALYTLNYCFQLRPRFALRTSRLLQHSRNGIPNYYESGRMNYNRNSEYKPEKFYAAKKYSHFAFVIKVAIHAFSDTYNPFNNLFPQERYALCRLIFQSSFFANSRVDVRISTSYGAPIVGYLDNNVFNDWTGESMEYINFENPGKPGQLPVPPNNFGLEKVIWCDGTDGRRYHVIFAYYELSVYVMEKVGTFSFQTVQGGMSNTSYPLYRTLTQIDDVAAVDKLRGEMFF